MKYELDHDEVLRIAVATAATCAVNAKMEPAEAAIAVALAYLDARDALNSEEGDMPQELEPAGPPPPPPSPERVAAYERAVAEFNAHNAEQLAEAVFADLMANLRTNEAVH